MSDPIVITLAVLIGVLFVMNTLLVIALFRRSVELFSTSLHDQRERVNRSLKKLKTAVELAKTQQGGQVLPEAKRSSDIVPVDDEEFIGAGGRRFGRGRG